MNPSRIPNEGKIYIFFVRFTDIGDRVTLTSRFLASNNEDRFYEILWEIGYCYGTSNMWHWNQTRIWYLQFWPTNASWKLYKTADLQQFHWHRCKPVLWDMDVINNLKKTTLSQHTIHTRVHYMYTIKAILIIYTWYQIFMPYPKILQMSWVVCSDEHIADYFCTWFVIRKLIIVCFKIFIWKWMALPVYWFESRYSLCLCKKYQLRYKRHVKYHSVGIA